MLYVFLLTGAFGLLYAYAFVRTGSVVLPIALHLGSNLVTILVFSNGPLGPQLLIADQINLPPMAGYQQFMVSLILPAIFIGLCAWLIRQKVSVGQR